MSITILIKARGRCALVKPRERTFARGYSAAAVPLFVDFHALDEMFISMKPGAVGRLFMNFYDSRKSCENNAASGGEIAYCSRVFAFLLTSVLSRFLSSEERRLFFLLQFGGDN